MGSKDPSLAGFGTGTYYFMLLLKVILALEGVGCFALAAAYIAGLIGYNGELMSLPLQPTGQQLPYLPVNSNGDGLTNTNFYYAHSSRSQVALGALTFLHAVCSLIVASCCCRGRIKRQSISWTIAGFLNVLTAIVAVGLTFVENNESGSQYPTASKTSVDYWTYGHWTAEEWVCGQGKNLVNLKQSANNMQPLGGSDAVNNFDKYCKEAMAAKWLSVIILLTSLVFTVIGIVTFVRARRAQKSAPLPPKNPQMSYSSGEEGYGFPPQPAY